MRTGFVAVVLVGLLGCPAGDDDFADDPAAIDPDGTSADIGLHGGPGAGTLDLDRDGYPECWHPGPYDTATDSPTWDCDDTDPGIYPPSGC